MRLLFKRALIALTLSMGHQARVYWDSRGATSLRVIWQMIHLLMLSRVVSQKLPSMVNALHGVGASRNMVICQTGMFLASQTFHALSSIGTLSTQTSPGGIWVQSLTYLGYLMMRVHSTKTFPAGTFLECNTCSMRLRWRLHSILTFLSGTILQRLITQTSS